ncbi:MAG: hypothetical protein Q7S92_06985 [Candidatus Diapherotrites archaeon]|nr:hypothetical protein [Candidatus Diapherotrites archaeon]
MKLALIGLIFLLLLGCVSSQNYSEENSTVLDSVKVTELDARDLIEDSKTIESTETVLVTGDFEINPASLVDKFEFIQEQYPDSLAESKFFKGDLVAEKILAGQQTYDLKEYESIRENNRTLFGFKILNALKMLGYKTACTTGYADCYLNYLKNNQLPETENVAQEGLRKLDQDLSEQEQMDEEIGKQFVLYSELKEENLGGEPSKNHLAYVIQKAFNLLPEKLMDNRFGLGEFIRLQFDTLTGEPAYQCNLEKKCMVSFNRLYYGNIADINQMDSVGAIWSDLSFASTLIHEYAHYLDLKVYDYFYGKGLGNKIAVIDTNSFYSISYDLSSEIIHEIGWSYYKIKDNSQKRTESFVTQYADGWSQETAPDHFTAYEDFAESFSMYIFAGDIFRCQAEKYPVLKQKYDWLKNNVFDQTEYSYESVTTCIELPQNVKDHYELNSEFTQFKFSQLRKT